MGLALLERNVSADAALFGAAAGSYAYVVSGAMTGVVMIAAAVVILRTAVFWRWLGWAGASIGVASIAGILALIENDPRGLFTAVAAVAWLAYFLRIAALSIGLIRARDDYVA
jgi:hypothetical protein